jgi:hypothetical protein
MNGQGDICAPTSSSDLGSFLTDVWPGLHGSQDVLVDTTLPVPYDFSLPPKNNDGPPFIGVTSSIWTTGWNSGDKPSADLIRRWLSAQRERRVDCASHSERPWGVKVVSSAEAGEIIRSRSAAATADIKVIRIGVPVLSRSGKQGLLRYSSSQQGLAGEDVLILYSKDSGRWHEAGRVMLSQS